MLSIFAGPPLAGLLNFMTAYMRKKKKQQRNAKRPGLPPGTLIYTGKHSLQTAQVILVEFTDDHCSEQKTHDKLPVPQYNDCIHWYDIRGLQNVALIEDIGAKFGIHPLILEDILNIEQRPKFEEYDNGLFIIAEFLHFDNEAVEVETEQVSIFVGERMIISFQEKETDLFGAVRERLEAAKGRLRKRGADYLAYALLDAIVDHYFEILDRIDEVLDNLESEILAQPGNHCKAQIHALKLNSLYMRKHITPLREAVSQFSRNDSPIIQSETGLFLRDLYDHVVRVVDMLETQRDLLNGLYDLYLSGISYKMNNVMQILTIMSTIFIPLTFLAGVYGMNFDNMPELHWKYGYFILLASMLLTALGLLYVFYKKKWL